MTLEQLCQNERKARELWDAHLATPRAESFAEAIEQEIRGKNLFNTWYAARKAFDAALDAEAVSRVEMRTSVGMAAE